MCYTITGVLIAYSHTSISNPSKSSKIEQEKKHCGKIPKCPNTAVSWAKLYWSVVGFSNKKIWLLESSNFKETRAMQNEFQSLII